MTSHLLIDFAWSKVPAAAAKADGYDGCLGYLSTDPSKNLTPAVVADYHGQGLAVGMVWETTSTRAESGTGGGVQDAAAAYGQARALGAPPGVCVYFAVDEDIDPAKAAGYFAAVQHAANEWGYRHGVYGSLRLEEGIRALGYAQLGWQTSAWSGGQVDAGAALYQRQSHTRPAIPGVASGAYDEDVQFAADAGLWLPAPVAPPAPAPAPVPVPTSEDDDGMRDCYLRTDSKGHVYYVNLAALIKIYLATEAEVGQWTFLLTAAGHPQNAVITSAPDNILAACATVQPGGLQS